MSQWEVVIGLEVHVQLQTQSKIFSGSSTAFGSQPNAQANAVDLALPGTLPVMNKEAARMACLFGYAVNAEVNAVSQFARKNYFYPDLPKGYQTSQMALPIVGPGYLDIELDGKTKRICITRAHLEEDAGKSLHEDFHGMTGIDLNRAGTPLLEIVSEPDLRSAREAVAYLKRLHALVRTIGISDGNMQEGSFRCDANVSIRPMGEKKLGTRAEVKNVNSFRFIERAINFEIERQIDLIEAGGSVHQETRLYDAELDETRSMRSKEEAHDYRYFPCPDLPTMVLDEAWLSEIKSSLPELPWQREQRFIEQYGLSQDDAIKLTDERAIADYYEEVVSSCNDAKSAANWINGEVASWLNREDETFNVFPIESTQLGLLITRVNDNTLSNKMAKQVFESLTRSEGEVDSIIEAKGLKQISDSAALEKMVDEVIDSFADQVQQYRDGNQKVLGFLVGQLMKASKGQANPKQLNELLRKKLDG